MRILLFFTILCIGNIGYSQFSYDNCTYAKKLPELDEYCSEKNEFTNIGATTSNQPRPNCAGEEQKDVWFLFVPKNLGASIQVLGKTSTSGETLVAPYVAVFEGNCTDMTQVGNLCNSGIEAGIAEVNYTEFKIGQAYYIRVGSIGGGEGSFKICIRQYSPKPSPQSDCINAVILCDKQPFVIDRLEGIGMEEKLGATCFPASVMDQENASVWYTWTCDKPGTLTFDILPINPGDDMDFMIYKLTDQGTKDCDSKELIRCMGSGEPDESKNEKTSPCLGPTGLSESSTDVSENFNCSPGDDNYLKALDMQTGDKYVMIVNNYSTTGHGFEIRWGGSGTFLGPEPDFAIDTTQGFECDKDIKFVDQSKDNGDSITEYAWSFGHKATPGFSDMPGNHVVRYESFGKKTAAFTVKTARGCVVTQTRDFFVKPCCTDATQISTTTDSTDVRCFGDSNGSVEIKASGGWGEYTYTINGQSLANIPYASGLPVGNYTITVIDEKGCTDTVSTKIDGPEKLRVDAGRDTIIDLGDSINLAGSFGPFTTGKVLWTNDSTGVIKCPTCLDTEVTPLREGQYVLEIINDAGCIERDTLTIRVNAVREIHAPNVFRPDGDRKNDYFNIFAGKSVERIEELLVYDRWGNLVYKGSPAFNSQYEGWDGTVKGKPAELGLYTWLVKVLYKDKVVLPHSGGVTIVR